MHTLFNVEVIQEFMSGEKKYCDLPIVEVELFITNEVVNYEINGKKNSIVTERNGLKMRICPNDDLSELLTDSLVRNVFVRTNTSIWSDMMNYPARVISIEDNLIKISGYINDVSKERLIKRCDIKKITDNELVITYKSSALDAFSDTTLIDKLLLIRDIGIPFGEDHKVIYSPAEFMRELLSRDYKIGRIKTINGSGKVREFG